jgi:ornithine cyclodeaminase/alanine dehydrogenase
MSEIEAADRGLLYLSRADVESVAPSMSEVIERVEAAFREKGRGRVEMPPKPGIHPRPDSFIHAMPAWIPSLDAAGVKWVSGYPGNVERSLPYINGLLILNEPATGVPMAVMDCVWITAVRTAAATAVAAQRLARTDSSVLGVLGCGVQGRTHVTALATRFPLERVVGYDTDRAAFEAFAQWVAEHHAIEVARADSPRAAVSGCDLVVTAGPILLQPHATIAAGWMDQGTFASLVDFDSYWHPDALAEFDKFCTDDVPQLEHYRRAGYFQRIPPIHAELGQLVVGARPGRESETERTAACNLGLAIDDMAVAPLVYRRAAAAGVGTRLPL